MGCCTPACSPAYGSTDRRYGVPTADGSLTVCSGASIRLNTRRFRNAPTPGLALLLLAVLENRLGLLKLQPRLAHGLGLLHVHRVLFAIAFGELNQPLNEPIELPHELRVVR